MANFFDQFDQQPASGNFFDQFDAAPANVPDQGVNRTQKADIAQGFTGTPTQANQAPSAGSVDSPALSLTAGINREFEAVSQGVTPATFFNEKPLGLVFNVAGKNILVDSNTGERTPIEGDLEDQIVIFTDDNGMRVAFPRTDENQAGLS